MSELQQIERRLASVARIENPISVCVGLALAIPYLLSRWHDHVIAVYSWTIPFLVGGAVSKFACAWYAATLHRTRREITHPSLPEARMLEATREPPPAEVEPVAIVAPEPPATPGDEPRLLK